MYTHRPINYRSMPAPDETPMSTLPHPYEQLFISLSLPLLRGTAFAPTRSSLCILSLPQTPLSCVYKECGKYAVDLIPRARIPTDPNGQTIPAVSNLVDLIVVPFAFDCRRSNLTRRDGGRQGDALLRALSHLSALATKAAHTCRLQRDDDTISVCLSLPTRLPLYSRFFLHLALMLTDNQRAEVGVWK